MHFQWYPGHMTKAKRMMQENIKLIDLVIELVDARIPISSRNPDIDELGKNKSRMILLNKSDLADPQATKQWMEYFSAKGIETVEVNARNGNGLKNIQAAVAKACAAKIERDRKRGILNRPVRAMVVGIPNVGKSTFIKVIMGVHQAEEGEMLLYGKPVHFKSTRDAQKAGIAAIYQHVTAYPHLSVAENIFTGHLKKKMGVVQWKEMYDEADKLLKELNADFDSKALMGNLSVAQQQMVEICKALMVDAKVIIMDEPTAALDPIAEAEIYSKFDEIAGDKTAIYISHRLSSCRFCDEIMVFDQGRLVQQGKHDTLVGEQDGMYYSLWNAQAQYYTA